jgi:ABC-type antimicrobial peptide transport system permease subunit
LPSPWAPVIVRARAGSSGIAAEIAQRVARLNPTIAVEFTDLKSQIRERLITERLVAWLASAFGVLAVVLVTVGLYGIIAYLALSRRNEIGIRLSLGATRGQIVSLVLRESLWPLTIGLAAGFALTAATMRGARTLLFDLSPTDLPTMVGAGVLLLIAAAAAACIPAWRAARTPPGIALRCE